jgi:hypothetical protein
MKSSPRDKVLALILPALLAGVGYLFLYYWPEEKILNGQREQLIALRQKAPGVRMQLAQKQQQLAQADQELKALNDDMAKLEARWTSLVGSASTDRLTAEKIDQLTGLLIRHGLTVLEIGPAKGDELARVPPALEAIAKRIGEKSGGKLPQYRLRLSGSYLGLLRVLEHVNDREAVAIPISLTMKENEEGFREWVLVVWI